MSGLLAIAGKEIRVYLTTPISYALAASYVLLTAFFFERLLVQFQALALAYRERQQLADALNLTDFVMTPLFFWMVTFLMFILPLVTMRLFAEERRSRTLELLLTTPVSAVEIVLGKYLGALALMGAMIALTGLFPLVLVALGESSGGPILDAATVLSGYTGVFLAGAAFIALGMLTSTLTDSQLVAALLSLTLSVVFLVLGLAAPGLDGVVREVLNHVSLATHVTDFARGIVRVSALVYYATVIALGLFLCVRVLEGQRGR
ncbi:MAG: ABC transporter permease subunit [Myxococcota bacterium]